jgi:hypothetical protein
VVVVGLAGLRNSRKSLRGSTGVPIGVVNTHPLSRQSDPAAACSLGRQRAVIFQCGDELAGQRNSALAPLRGEDRGLK